MHCAHDGPFIQSRIWARIHRAITSTSLDPSIGQQQALPGVHCPDFVVHCARTMPDLIGKAGSTGAIYEKTGCKTSVSCRVALIKCRVGWQLI